MRIFRYFRIKAIQLGSVKQYLLYAISEIFLIVIGILIALQFNLWNENRNNKKKLATYYDRLIVDLKSNISDFDFMIKTDQTRLDKIKSFILLLYKKKNIDEIKELFTNDNDHIFVPINRDPTSNTFEDLKSTGNLHLIEDITLKNQIINYYTEFDSRSKSLDNLNKVFQNFPPMNALKEKLTMYEQIYNNAGFNLDWEWLNQPNSELYKKLEESLLNISDVRKTKIRLVKLLKSTAEKTIAVIQKKKGKS